MTLTVVIIRSYGDLCISHRALNIVLHKLQTKPSCHQNSTDRTVGSRDEDGTAVYLPNSISEAASRGPCLERACRQRLRREEPSQASTSWGTAGTFLSTAWKGSVVGPGPPTVTVTDTVSAGRAKGVLEDEFLLEVERT